VTHGVLHRYVRHYRATRAAYVRVHESHRAKIFDQSSGGSPERGTKGFADCISRERVISVLVHLYGGEDMPHTRFNPLIIWIGTKARSILRLFSVGWSAKALVIIRAVPPPPRKPPETADSALSDLRAQQISEKNRGPPSRNAPEPRIYPRRNVLSRNESTPAGVRGATGAGDAAECKAVARNP